MAHAAHRGREGIVLLDHLQSLFVPLLRDEGDIALGACICGAGELAGAGALLGDDVRAGHGLRVGFEGRCAFRQALIELTGNRNGTNLGAVVAGCAIFEADVAGTATDRGGELACLAIQAEQVRVGEDLDVAMPVRLDQFGRQDAHGAVVGGKRLVELRHFAANGGFALGEEYLHPRVGQIQCGLDSSNAAPNHERCPYRVDLRRFSHWASFIVILDPRCASLRTGMNAANRLSLPDRGGECAGSMLSKLFSFKT